ncbi:MAG: F0F1 ATP synthase subunit B family protein [Pseudomonadota bacterium]
MFADPGVWVLVAFLIFIAAVAKPIGKLLVGALDDHAAAVKADLERAAKLREETQALLAQNERQHRDAVRQAAEIVERATLEAKRLKAQAEADLEAALKRREQLALQNIAQAEARALSEVREAAVDLAVAATAKLIAERLDGGRAAAFIERATRDLPGKLT